MAANRFEISISCVDKATATINRINATIEKMTRPLNDLGKSLARLSKASGLSKIGTELTKAAKAAGKLASAVGKVAAPMMALIGGGTLAGLYELATGWARLGAETARTAQILGISAQDLDALRNAGQLAGVSAQTMTDGFRAFGDTLQDAKWGRNQAAFATLQYLGIGLKQTKDGAIDTQEALIEFADKVKQVQQRDPAAARRLASTFGVEALLPVLMKGSAAMRAYQADAARLAGIKTPAMLAHAEGFALSLNKMGIAADGLKASIGDKLIPVIQPLIDKWTDWIAANRELISQKVEELAGRIASALATIDLDKLLDGMGQLIDGCVNLVKDIDDLVRSMGGWKQTIEIIGDVIALSFIAPLVSATAQIGGLIGKLGLLAGSWGNVERAAALTSGAMSGAAKAGLVGLAAYGGEVLLDKTTDEGSAANQYGHAALNGAAIGGAIGSFVPGIGTVIGAGIGAIGGALWQGANDLQKRGLAEKTTKFFEGKGWSHNQALGITANIERESQYNADAKGDNGEAYGLGQWHKDRQAQFEKLYGHTMQKGSFDEQLAFYDWELRNSNKAAGDRLSQANTPGESAAVVSSLFERPRDQAGEAAKRGSIAEQMAASEQGATGQDGRYDQFEQRRNSEQAAPAPQIQVSIQTKVDARGGVRTQVDTPAGVKIQYTSPVMAGS